MDRADQYSDPQLERSALAALLQDSDVATRYFPRLLPGHFTDENTSRLFTLTRRYVLRAGVVPTREVLRVELSILYPRDESVAGSILEIYDQLIATSRASPPAYLIDRLMNFARVRDMLSSVQRSIRLLDDGRMEDSLRVYESGALELQEADPSVFISRGEVIEDFEKRKALLEDMRRNPDKYRGVLTGIDELDRVSGGLWNGELGFCFGKTGVGKSFFLLQTAYCAYKNDLRVLVIPVEMPLLQWQRRFDARISKVAYERFKWATLTESEEQQWTRSILQSRDDHFDRGARVFITHMPIRSPVTGIRMELERLIRQGTPADLLIVDYAGLLLPLELGYSQQERLTNTFQELKGMATSYDVPIWTAAQSTKVSYGSDHLSAEDVGYAMGIIHIADTAIGLARSDEDTLAQRLFLSLPKFRDGMYNRVITCHPNFALGMVHDTT